MHPTHLPLGTEVTRPPSTLEVHLAVMISCNSFHGVEIGIQRGGGSKCNAVSLPRLPKLDEGDMTTIEGGKTRQGARGSNGR